MKEILQRILGTIAAIAGIALLILIVGLVIFKGTEPKKEKDTQEFTRVTTEAVATASDSVAEEIESEEWITATTEAPVATMTNPTRPSSGLSDYNFPELTAADDKEDPIFLIYSKNVSIGVGSTFDVHDHVGYADDVDRELDLKVNGTVDTSKEGDYNLTLTLTDDAGHSTVKDMTVSVVAGSGQEPGPSEVKPSESFSDFAEKYGGDNVELGLDVSRWQNDIDFNKVKAAGCDYVIIRIGGYDDDEHYVDKKYIENIKNAKAAGLKVGIYWHAEESTVEETVASTEYLLKTLGGEKLDFPIAYDWEDFQNFENYGMNMHDINNNFEVFCNELEKAGYEACLYSSKNFLENTWTNENNHEVWLAHYTDETNYTGDYYMWQHCNDGKIDGISTAADFNVYYKDR